MGSRLRENTAQTVRRKVRDEDALSLHIAGATDAAVARELGLANSTSARRSWQRALDARKVPDETLDVMRRREDARLNQLLLRLQPKVMAGDVPAIREARRISESRRRLWGIDAPIRIAGADGGPVQFDLQMKSESRVLAAILADPESAAALDQMAAKVVPLLPSGQVVEPELDAVEGEVTGGG